MTEEDTFSYRVEMDLKAISDNMARRIAMTQDALVLEALERVYGFVRVVQCRDCKHIYEFDLSGFYGNHEHDHYSCCRLTDPGVISVEPYGFCAWGERKVVEVGVEVPNV